MSQRPEKAKLGAVVVEHGIEVLVPRVSQCLNGVKHLDRAPKPPARRMALGFRDTDCKASGTELAAIA
jgi:hypothetical protein